MDSDGGNAPPVLDVFSPPVAYDNDDIPGEDEVEDSGEAWSTGGCFEGPERSNEASKRLLRCRGERSDTRKLAERSREVSRAQMKATEHPRLTKRVLKLSRDSLRRNGVRDHCNMFPFRVVATRRIQIARSCSPLQASTASKLRCRLS